MATLKLFRCSNPACQKQDLGKFCATASKPPCPQCGIDPDHPRFGDFIDRLVMIHLDPPSEMEGYGMGFRACDPTKPIVILDTGGMPNPYHAGTGNAKVVNCPECMKTYAYAVAMALLDEDDEDRIGSGTAPALARIGRKRLVTQ